MKTEKGNIIFICLTPFHFYISYSYIKNLKLEERGKEVIIIYVQGLNRFAMDFKKMKCIRVIEIPELFSNSFKRYWKRIFYGGKLFKFSSLSKLITSNSKIFVFNDTEPISWKIINEAKRIDYNNKVILIDEGTGLYNLLKSKKKSKLSKVKSILTKIIGNEIKDYSIGMSDEIDYIFAKEPEMVLKVKLENKVVLKQSINLLFKNENIENFNRIININSEIGGDNLKGEKSVLFIDQPISEYICPENSLKNESLFIEKVISNISSEVNIFIKPHPRDNLEKYKIIRKKFKNVKILDDKNMMLPIECLLAYFKDEIIITYNSSAGINAKYINPDIKVLFIYELFCKFLTSRGYRINNLNSDVLENQRGNNCFILDNWEIFLNVINDQFCKKTKKNFITTTKNEDFDFLENILKNRGV